MSFISETQFTSSTGYTFTVKHAASGSMELIKSYAAADKIDTVKITINRSDFDADDWSYLVDSVGEALMCTQPEPEEVDEYLE